MTMKNDPEVKRQVIRSMIEQSKTEVCRAFEELGIKTDWLNGWITPVSPVQFTALTFRDVDGMRVGRALIRGESHLLARYSLRLTVDVCECSKQQLEARFAELVRAEAPRWRSEKTSYILEVESRDFQMTAGLGFYLWDPEALCLMPEDLELDGVRSIVARHGDDGVVVTDFAGLSTPFAEFVAD